MAESDRDQGKGEGFPPQRQLCDPALAYSDKFRAAKTQFASDCV